MSQVPPEAHDLRRAFLSRTHEPPPSAECPPPDRLWESAAGALPIEEDRQIVDHTAACPACAAAWRLAREMGAEEASRVVRPLWERVGSAHWMRFAAAALAALTLSGLALSLRRPRPVESPAYRVPEQQDIRSLVPVGETLRRSACLLRWSAGLPGARYAVYVTDEDLNGVADGRELESEQFTVPEKALSALPTGSRLLWRVEAFLPDGRRRASPTFVNRLE